MADFGEPSRFKRPFSTRGGNSSLKTAIKHR